MQDAVKAILQLQSESKMTEKKKIISDYKNNENFRTLLYYSLHPMLTYKISERTLRRPMPFGVTIQNPFNNIFEVCRVLSTKKALDDSTVFRVKVFIDNIDDIDMRELYTKLLSKTLRLGVTAKTVNKVIPGLIPEWEVQQAFPIEKYPLKKNTWFALTQKLNGVRATYYRGNLYARSGEVYDGLDHIIDEIEKFGDKGMVFDGELTLLEKSEISDNEAFRIAAGIVNSCGDGVNKTRICYTIFDVLPEDEFESGQSLCSYQERRKKLDDFSQTLFKDTQFTRVLPVLYAGTDQTQIDILLEQMVREDKEGLMINLDVPYKCKRHNGILKVKRFYTMDLPVVRCEEGTGRLTGTLGAFVLNYKGNEVSVGSGFTDTERAIFWHNRDRITDMLCEVKYKEISQDKKTGAESLQFPIFICLRTDKTEPNYE